MIDWNYILSQIATVAFDILYFWSRHRYDCHYHS